MTARRQIERHKYRIISRCKHQMHTSKLEGVNYKLKVSSPLIGSWDMATWWGPMGYPPYFSATVPLGQFG